MADVDRIGTVANLLLDAVEAAAVDAAWALPDRRYVHVGAVAYDCEQVAVQTDQIGRGTTSETFAGEVLPADVWTASFRVHLIRCVPTLDDQGRAPSVNELNGAAYGQHRDGAVLTLFLLTHLKSLDAVCTSVAAGPAVAVGPDGGFGGWTLDVAVAL